jgi:hypothetical protein
VIGAVFCAVGEFELWIKQFVEPMNWSYEFEIKDLARALTTAKLTNLMTTFFFFSAVLVI